jgi:hypothetical protein
MNNEKDGLKTCHCLNCRELKLCVGINLNKDAVYHLCGECFSKVNDSSSMVWNNFELEEEGCCG